MNTTKTVHSSNSFSELIANQKKIVQNLEQEISKNKDIKTEEIYKNFSKSLKEDIKEQGWNKKKIKEYIEDYKLLNNRVKSLNNLTSSLSVNNNCKIITFQFLKNIFGLPEVEKEMCEIEEILNDLFGCYKEYTLFLQSDFNKRFSNQDKNLLKFKTWCTEKSGDKNKLEQLTEEGLNVEHILNAYLYSECFKQYEIGGYNQFSFNFSDTFDQIRKKLPIPMERSDAYPYFLSTGEIKEEEWKIFEFNENRLRIFNKQKFWIQSNQENNSADICGSLDIEIAAKANWTMKEVSIFYCFSNLQFNDDLLLEKKNTIFESMGFLNFIK